MMMWERNEVGPVLIRVGKHLTLTNICNQRNGGLKTTRKSKQTKTVQKSKQTKAWKERDEEETNALRRAFLHNIERGVGAQKYDVVREQQNFPILNDRQIPQISSQVNNLIKKHKKKQQEN